MNNTHRLKCWPKEFNDVKKGVKTHEFRRDDRGGYQPGDKLILQEWVPSVRYGNAKPRLLAEGQYTGEEIAVSVTCVSRGGFGIPFGYCVMSIKLEDKDNG